MAIYVWMMHRTRMHPTKPVNRKSYEPVKFMSQPSHRMPEWYVMPMSMFICMCALWVCVCGRPITQHSLKPTGFHLPCAVEAVYDSMSLPTGRHSLLNRSNDRKSFTIYGYKWIIIDSTDASPAISGRVEFECIWQAKSHELPYIWHLIAMSCHSNTVWECGVPTLPDAMETNDYSQSLTTVQLMSMCHIITQTKHHNELLNCNFVGQFASDSAHPLIKRNLFFFRTFSLLTENKYN